MSKLTLFGQIVQSIDRNIFNKLVKQKGADKHNKGINSWTHFITMLFAHFSQFDSLRPICKGLQSATGNLNHLGIQNKTPTKSTLSYINAKRDWTLFKDFYFELLKYFDTNGQYKQNRFRIKRKILLLDATVIGLCLELYDWAKYRKQKGALKLHTVLDYDNCLPVYVHMTEGKQHDNVAAKSIVFQSGSVVVADRGYLDFAMQYNWHQQGVAFVVRCKDNMQYKVIKERQLPDTKDQHVLLDEEIELTNSYEKYPAKLRRIVVLIDESGTTVEVITNNFTWTAATIALLYKSRWQIEIFFKEIKQHLRIKSFVGQSQNAVLIQIWTALITILLFRYLQKKASHKWSLSSLVAFLRLNLFVKIDLMLWLNEPFEDHQKTLQPQFEFG